MVLLQKYLHMYKKLNFKEWVLLLVPLFHVLGPLYLNFLLILTSVIFVYELFKKKLFKEVKLYWVYFYLIFIFIIISLLFRFILVNFLSYSSIETAYLDSFLFIFSLFTTYLQYKKIFENWIYWIIINSIYAYLCFNNQLYYIMILAIIYTILSIRGYIKWKIKLFITYK
jgi:hypothetical protein